MYEMVNLKDNDVLGIGQTDSIFFSEDEYKAIRQEVIEAPEEGLNLLDAFPIREVAKSLKHYKYTTLDKYGDAGIIVSPGDFPALTLDGSEASIRIPMKAISYAIEKDDIVNSRLLGAPLDTTYARVAGERVKKLQDECLYTKSTVFGTQGIYGQGTGAFSGTNWTTATTDIYDQVRLWIQEIPIAYRNGNSTNMRMFLEGTQYSELFKRTWENSTGSTEGLSGNGTWWDIITKAYPNLVIQETQWATTATGVLYPFSANVAERVMGIPVQNVELKQDVFIVKAAAIGRDVLAVYAPTAVVKASGI